MKKAGRFSITDAAYMIMLIGVGMLCYEKGKENYITGGNEMALLKKDGVNVDADKERLARLTTSRKQNGWKRTKNDRKI